MIMEERIRGKDIMGKTVVSKEGRKFGSVGDVMFDPGTGELLKVILTNVTQYAKNLLGTEMRVPFSAVVSIGDFVIVSEEDLV
jgi:sporulation protein YlmC with PRC-barrel domain